MQAFLAAQYDLDLAYSRFAKASELQRRPPAKPSRQVPRHWVLAYLALPMFWVSGLTAVIFAYQVRRKENAGDMAAAWRYSRRVLIAFWISAGFLVLTVGVDVATALASHT